MKFTISNYFILISLIIYIVAFSNKDLYIYGMNNYFISNGNYFSLLLQFIFYNFLHGSLLHWIFNSFFLNIFGNQVEQIIGKKRYILFFILNTIFVGISILIFSSQNTIGISGYCMALLSFYTLKLYDIKNPDYKGGITAIIINVIIGLSPGISLVGHLFGAIFGIIYYYIIKKINSNM